MNNTTSNSSDSNPERDALLDERYLERISALVDGELDAEWLLPTLDFLVRTPDARSFYVEARALSGVLEGTGLAESTAKLDPSLWAALEVQAAQQEQRIASEQLDGKEASLGGKAVDLEQHRRQHTNKLSHNKSSSLSPLWAIAAALFAAVIGLASFELWKERNAPPAQSQSQPDQLASVGPEVTVGGKPGAMNDQRFITLATEMLEADRRYRKEMLALMEAVEAQPISEKSTSESDVNDREGNNFGESSGEADGRNRDGVEINLW